MGVGLRTPAAPGFHRGMWDGRQGPGLHPTPGPKESCCSHFTHSALPYIPDPTSPPRLGPVGLWGGWGSGLGWGWGAVLDFRVGPHQPSALSLGGGVWISVAPEPVPGGPVVLPRPAVHASHPCGLGGSSLAVGAVREKGRRPGRGEEGRAQISSEFITGV